MPNEPVFNDDIEYHFRYIENQKQKYCFKNGINQDFIKREKKQKAPFAELVVMAKSFKIVRFF